MIWKSEIRYDIEWDWGTKGFTEIWIVSVAKGRKWSLESGLYRGRWFWKYVLSVLRVLNGTKFGFRWMDGAGNLKCWNFYYFYIGSKLKDSLGNMFSKVRKVPNGKKFGIWGSDRPGNLKFGIRITFCEDGLIHGDLFLKNVL